MDNWNFIRTAYTIAKLGTVSAAANELNLHRATVMRHVDALEEELGTRLFIRNDKGYIATDAGQQILRVGDITEQQFKYLASRIGKQEDELQGSLTITSLDEMVEYLLPSIRIYQQQFPAMKVNFIGDIKNFDLEYGEADIAIRSGPKPKTPDNVVIALGDFHVVYAASKAYVQEHGIPDSKASMAQHQFITMHQRLEFMLWHEWLHNNVPESCLNLSFGTGKAINQAVTAGLGIGFMGKAEVAARDDLVQVYTPEVWPIGLWCLVHKDVYPLPKVKHFVSILRQEFAQLLA